MTTQRTYPITRNGFGGVAFYAEDGSARTTAIPGTGTTLSTLNTNTGSTGPWASTEATDTMSAFGQPPQGAWASTEAADTATIKGWSQRKPNDLIQTWNHCYSSGNRLSVALDGDGNGMIDQVTTNLAGATQFADAATAFNGREGSDGGANGPYYGGTPTINQTSIKWRIGSAVGSSAIINGLRFASSDFIGPGPYDWGAWNFYGSIDDVTYFEIGSFLLQLTANGYCDDNGISLGAAGCTINFGGDNVIANIAWKYFLLVWEGGGWAGNRLTTGIDFMAFADQNTANHTATVSHSSGITVSGGSPSGTLAEWQDGIYTYSWPINGSAITPVIHGVANGEYFQFDWGAGKYVAPFRVRFNIGPAAVGINYGTCQWSASNDGTTWTNIGSTFTLDMGNQEDAIFELNDTHAFYQMWRLTFVSTTQTQFSGVSEVTFDMLSYTYDVLKVTEAPDGFSAHGYVGAYGFTGQLAATEAKDTFAASGYEADVGTWASTEGKDTMSVYGYEPVAGPWHSTEATDTFAATGLGRGENGTWTSTESVDTLTIIGYTPTSGTLAATENPDTARFVGAGVTTSRQRRILVVT